jgi:uncharacterized protein (DUF1684 family)
MSELAEFRAEKDAFFREHAQSPLTLEQRATFDGLEYYPDNADLVIRTQLETEGVDLEEVIAMQTTAGGQQTYRRAGIVRFEVDGVPTKVTPFASSDTQDLFLPFRDATSGRETYGAGRYLDVDPPDPRHRVIVDFNYAYNPFCAYNPDWSCPIPPGENWIPVPIRAGEKSFPGAHELAIA